MERKSKNKEWIIRILIFLTSGGLGQIIEFSDEAQEWIAIAKKSNPDGKEMVLKVQVPDSLQIARRSK